jgi:hypothetical protein
VVLIEALLDGHAGAGDGIGGLGWSAQDLGLSDGALLPQLSPAANLTGFFVVFPLAQFLLQSTAFQELLESAQSRADGFPIMNAHP